MKEAIDRSLIPASLLALSYSPLLVVPGRLEMPGISPPVSAPATSLAINAASIPVDTAVPTPGTVDATPEATSPIAPNQSPFIALSIPKATPATAPSNGTFLMRDLPTPLPTAFAIVLPPILAAILPPTAEVTGLNAFAPKLTSLLPCLARALPTKGTLLSFILARRRIAVIVLLGFLILLINLVIPLAEPN